MPFLPDYGEYFERRKAPLNSGKGFSDDTKYRSSEIDTRKSFGLDNSATQINGKKYEVITLTIPFKDGSSAKIILGAHIIKESMAALYQSLVDPQAQHPDIPYNVVWHLCKNNYPSLYGNTKLLIAICYLSLFSMSPGKMLVDLLGIAYKDGISNGLTLYEIFIRSNDIEVPQREPIKISTYFDELVDGFKKKLSENLLYDLDYIAEALERVRISARHSPFLETLYEGESISVEQLNDLIGYMGIPYVHTATNGVYYPKSTHITEDSADDSPLDQISKDIIELLALEAMFYFLSGYSKDKICPLLYMCQATNYYKNGCFDTPWEMPECAFTIVTSPYKLQEKNIHW